MRNTARRGLGDGLKKSEELLHVIPKTWDWSARDDPAMITIESNYNGPATSGHGGFSAGRFAEIVNPNAATVRLHEPVPLDQPMRWLGGANKSVVFCDDRPIATVRSLAGPLPVGQFGRLASTEVEQAEAHWLDARDGEHMAPTCFACGHLRHDGSGLGLRPGRVQDSGLWATRWRPGAAGDVPPGLIWAVLDCPSGFPALDRVGRGEAVVTGQLAVEVRDRVRGCGDYQVISRRTAVDGRAHHTEAALIDERGVSVAVASAIWFTVPLALTLPQAPEAPAAA